MKHNDDLYEKRNSFFLELSGAGKSGILLAIAIGVVVFGVGLFVEPTRAWGSLLFNLMFFFSLALGGVAFGNMQDVVGATWGRPIKRIHESFGAFVPWASGIFIVYLLAIKLDQLGAGKIYKWVADPHMLDHFHGKNIWLQYDFMMIRDIFAIILTVGFTRWHLKLTSKRDLALVEGNKDEAKRLGKEAQATLKYWSAPILVVYSLTFSLIAFDLTMSLAPTWFSTLWGGWSFAIMMQTLMALTLIIMFYLKDTQVGQYIKRQQFHDVGKLMFGFTVFFAYLTYAHILTYWYGNVPEETSYFLTRMEAPWIYMVIASLFLSFFFPFFAMIPRVSKWAGSITIPVAVVILLAQWINYLLVVIPEVQPAGKSWVFPWIELGVFFGFLGLFLFSIFQFGKKVPMLSIADPLLEKALHEEH
ncbi:MAG: hypothetical protein HRU09_08420 [Oligoflexales bacterium]|nr:hypothetical protein [Oligoflexales bacterium]